MGLEDLLREACARGITHLTLYPVQTEGKSTVFWAARATPSTEHKYVHTSSADPVEALTEVLKAMPKAPKARIRGEVHRPDLPDPPAEPQLTATVSPDDLPPAPANDVDEWEKFR